VGTWLLDHGPRLGLLDAGTRRNRVIAHERAGAQVTAGDELVDQAVARRSGARLMVTVAADVSTAAGWNALAFEGE